jgi:NAD(P)-dependent dehydrogenase (short-subunit alcohol dehydrogenase family)
MPRSILVTEGSSPLGVVLVRLLAAHGYAVAAACDRGAGEAESSGDRLLSLPWNRRSAASARTVLLSTLNAFGTLDEALILEPPFTTAASALASASSAEVDRAFDDAKGPVLIAREVIGSFLAGGAGIVSFVSAGPASGPVEAAVREAFRGMATALMASPGGPGIIANGFQGGPIEPGEYAAFIDRTLEEKARKISGRWFSLPGRGGFLQGVFKTSSSP